MVEVVAAWIGCVGGVVGAITGVVALVQSRRANTLASNANQLAEVGNGIAERSTQAAGQAVVVAGEANSLAQEANQHATDANSIAKRALAVSQDQRVYHWVFKIDDDGSAIVRNDCAHAAVGVAVTIDSGGEVHAQVDVAQVPPFGNLELDVAGLLEEHLSKVERDSVPTPAYDSGGIFMAASDGSAVMTQVRMTVTWTTPDGVPRDSVVGDVLRHYKQLAGHVTRLR